METAAPKAVCKELDLARRVERRNSNMDPISSR